MLTELRIVPCPSIAALQPLLKSVVGVSEAFAFPVLILTPTVKGVRTDIIAPIVEA